MRCAEQSRARRLPPLSGALAVLSAILFCATAAPAASPAVTTGAVSFPSYDVGSSGENRGAGSVTLQCDTDCPGAYQLTLGTSLNGGTAGARRMKHASSERFLEYSLVLENEDGSWADSVTRTVTAGVPLTVRVSGVIGPLQNVPAGSFSDRVTVSVVW